MPSVTQTPVTSLELSWLAEKADGTRDVDLALVKDGSGELQIREPAAPGVPAVLLPGDVFIAPVRTNSTWLGDKVGKVTVLTQKGGQVEITDAKADAIFWTQSAVEKFLYPYYHSQRIWNSTMDDLKSRLETDPNIIGVLHRAPSNSQPVTVDQSLKIVRIKPGSVGIVPEIELLDLNEYL